MGYQNKCRYRWVIEIEAVIDSFLANTMTNMKHRLSFLESFIVFSLLSSGIQTPISLLLGVENDLVVINPTRNLYPASFNEYYCSCDDGGICYLPSSFYDAGIVDNGEDLTGELLQSELLLVVKNWFTGCWALKSILLASFNDSFLTNQTALDEITAYLSWSSQSVLPTSLNLTESKETNGSTGIFSDLVDTVFIETTVIKRNYSAYFQQCRPQSCLFSIKQHSSFLYIFTSLLTIYGGLSVVLRFIIPFLVAILVKRFARRFAIPVNTGKCAWKFLSIS